MQTTFTIQTIGQGLCEFTDQVASWVRGSGVLTFSSSTRQPAFWFRKTQTPKVRTDLPNDFSRLVPPANDPTIRYLTHRYEGDDNMPAHIKSAMLPVSIQIPVIEGRLALGTWQGIYLFEHRDAPHHRRVIATLG